MTRPLTSSDQPSDPSSQQPSTPSPQPAPPQDSPSLLQGFLQHPWILANVAIAILVLGKTLLDTTVGQSQPYQFPESATVDGWGLVDSQPLPPFKMPTGESDRALVGQQYTFAPETSTYPEPGADPDTDNDPAPETNPTAPRPTPMLTVELRYMQDTKGFITRLLLGHPDLRPVAIAPDFEPTVRYDPDTGYYGLFTHDNQAYLSACINPRGESTFTIDQFLHNQRIHDGNPSRIFEVIFGRDTWQDDRCLWTQMAIAPLAGSSDGSAAGESAADTLTPVEAYPLLEEAWTDWYQTWQPQFPAR